MATAITKGYTRFVTGQVHHGRALPLAEKFATLYATGASRGSRSHRRVSGKANAMLWMYPRYGSEYLDWWLLLTEGKHPAEEAETLHEVMNRETRLMFQDQFVALRLPSKGGRAGVTWRMAPRFYEDQRTTITALVRKRGGDEELAHVLRSLHRLPGFRGIRKQVAGLRLHTVAEWQRVRSEPHCPVVVGHVQPYQRYAKMAMVQLAEVVHRMAAGRVAIATAWRYPNGRGQVVGVKQDE